ncbi:hypothetical protein [Chitinophaga silvisoli]|uniref:Uncharacterized protein n=1 Tax=Chitinophaga silvisoli TaxID=2291814 RepID=A0A3E1P8B4_9BACT|nr:hypothetical protein [Chitinophaga silvisoli]RFM36436.1 hypothetical protein DXN04_02730 [Chitinophaga silvisoli]
MKSIWSVIIPATILMYACGGNGTKAGGDQQGSDTSAAFQPATPSGTVAVAFPADADTTRISIHFEADGQSSDKTFELPLARDVAEQDLYRAVWDKPNSVYIGVLKSDHSTRYYHASVDNGTAKINQVGTPPEAIWHYAEEKAGLGTISLDMKAVDSYEQQLQSGTIIADLIVKKLPVSTPDSVKIYAEYGGANKTIGMVVPAEATTGIVHSASHPEQAFLVQIMNKKYTNLVEIKVENGHLKINTLR